MILSAATTATHDARAFSQLGTAHRRSELEIDERCIDKSPEQAQCANQYADGGATQIERPCNKEIGPSRNDMKEIKRDRKDDEAKRKLRVHLKRPQGPLGGRAHDPRRVMHGVCQARSPE